MSMQSVMTGLWDICNLVSSQHSLKHPTEGDHDHASKAKVSLIARAAERLDCFGIVPRDAERG